MQIKITVSYYLLSVRMTIIKKTKDNNVGNGVEKKENPCTLLVGMQIGTAIMEPAIRVATSF